MVRVVVIGGSFGGLTVASELRRRVSAERAQITLIARDRRFTFVPSLTWVATGERSLERISFDLAAPLKSQRITFVPAEVTSIDPVRKVVETDAAQYPYDFLVIATGHRSANEAVPGLGPFDGPGHSPMSPREAVELGSAVRRLLERPGPVVIGAAPGASCLGPAYELAFELDHLLRRRRLRHVVPLSFVTPEPFVGHMGMGGAGRIRQLLEGAFEERDIPYQTSAAITRIADGAVEVQGSAPLPSVLSIVIPPLSGVPVVSDTPGLANAKGFVPVDTHYRREGLDGIYAVGVAVALPPADETPVPVNFPKTGHMTEQMAVVVARDIAARLGGREAFSAPLSARCVMDMGDRGIYMAVDPVRPPRDRIPKVSDGRKWRVVKLGFERAYLWSARHGRRLPTSLGW